MKKKSAGSVFLAQFGMWWLGAELNRRHKDFQSSALPTELPSRLGKFHEVLDSARTRRHVASALTDVDDQGLWNDKFLLEFEHFLAGRHDDEVDALSGAYENIAFCGSGGPRVVITVDRKDYALDCCDRIGGRNAVWGKAKLARLGSRAGAGQMRSLRRCLTSVSRGLRAHTNDYNIIRKNRGAALDAPNGKPSL